MRKSIAEEISELLDRDESEMLLIGAESDDDNPGDPDDDDDTEDSDDDDKPETGDDDDDADDDDDDEDSPEVAALKRRVSNLEAERGRNVSKRKEAEARAKKAEDELATLKASGAGEGEAKEAMANLTQENEGLKARLTDLALDNAFLKDNTFTWQDPSAALRLADLSNVEVDEDGTVHGLGTALEDLSKKSPWLLVSEDGKSKKPAPKKSGGPSGTKRKRGEASQAEKARKYQSKYPGLRRG